MKVLGLDLSLTSTGVALPDGTTKTWSPDCRGAMRLYWYEQTLLQLLREGPLDLIVIEGYAFGRPNQAAHIGELGGVVRLTLFTHGPEFCIVVSPASVKKYATGKGNAGKEEVLAAAIRRLGYEGHSNDEADALWLRAMGLDAYGEAPVAMPALNRSALDAVAWPDLSGGAAA